MPAVENLAELAREGYLPTDIDVDDGVVSLAKLAHRDFHEVWYSDTTDDTDPERHTVAPYQAFVEQFAVQREHLRLIAHTSRCGSTLLANLLTLRPTTMVLKEPDFVTIPAQRIALAVDRAEAERFDALLKALLNFSCHTATAAGRALVVKITSWTTSVVAASLRERENTSWLFSWREPAPVVASNLATPPTWGKDTENGRAARYLADVGDSQTGTAEFYAKTWQRTVDSFMSHGSDLRWRGLAYPDLASEKAASLVAMESLFDLAPSAELPDRFEQESNRYAKGPKAETFEPKKAHLREPLGQQEAKAVDDITGRAFTALRDEQDHRLF